jgi:ABC-type transporter Mla subunit MlaD
VYTEPTINDFLALIDRPLKEAIERAQHAVETVARSAARTGQTGNSVSLTFEAVRKEFDAGVQTALSRLRQVATRTNLDQSELRQQTVQRLMNFVIAAKSVTQPERLKSLSQSPDLAQYVDERLAVFDTDLAFQIRQFDVGFDALEPKILNSKQQESSNVGAAPYPQGKGATHGKRRYLHSPRSRWASQNRGGSAC